MYPRFGKSAVGDLRANRRVIHLALRDGPKENAGCKSEIVG